MRRARKPRQPEPPAPPQREEAFHSPFRALKEQLRAVSSPPPLETPPRTAAPAPPAPVPPSHPTPPPDIQARQEEDVFLTEMTGVTPLPKDRRGFVDKPRHTVPRAVDPNGDLAAMEALQALVEGRGAFTIQYTDEYMEGVAPGVDRRLTKRLHRGDYAAQAHCDLHGYTVEEAKGVVEQFLTQAYATGQRCILIIHGRGRNSKDNRPVLKEQVQFWLSHGRLSRMVLAFATAPITNGGAGAVYVLLRRAPHLQRKW